VTNAGVIDLTTGSNSTSDSLRIVGNYVGNSGQLWLQSTLGNDSSPADKLVIEAGNASGSTGIRETNVGGAGDETDQGILVVQALNGATTNNNSFHLSQRVSAGIYEYMLVKGRSADTRQNWYLRNTFVDPVPPEIVPPHPEPIPPDLFPGCDKACESGGSGGGSNGSFVPGPAIRPEVPLLTSVPGMARGLIRDTMGTFHDRHGEQTWMADEHSGHAVWTRVFGGSYDRDLATLLDEQYDGHTFGLQAGLPIYEHEGENVLDTFGLFAGYSRGWGDVKADALNRSSINLGDIAINAYSLASYWTRTWSGGTYIDGVLMQSWLNPTTDSIGNDHSDFNGNAVTASLETGTTIALSDHWNVEPQGQIIWQYQHFDTTYDPGGSISYDDNNAFTGRLGMRLQGNYFYDEKKVSPFALANLWHDFSTTDVISFDGFPINAPRESTTLELGAGVTADLSANTRLYANASYAFNLGGDDFKTVAGRIGLRVRW
jgi:outer membrane autotransporter protein